MTGLEALREFKGNNNTMLVGRVMGKQHYLDCLKVMEQSLKALDVIKKKCLTNCNLALVKDNLHYQNYCKEFEYFLNKYNESPNGFEITKEDLLTEEEFNLLKGILNDEQ